MLVLYLQKYALVHFPPVVIHAPLTIMNMTNKNTSSAQTNTVLLKQNKAAYLPACDLYPL